MGGWGDQNLQEGKDESSPTSCRFASTTNGEALQNRQNRLKNPLLGAYPQEKGRKRISKRIHFELLSGRQNILVPKALSH